MSNEDETDKSFEASQKKLDDARKKGEIAKSVDLQTAAGYMGMLVALYVAGSYMLTELGTALSILVGQSAEISQIVFANEGQAIFGGLAARVGLNISPIFIIPALAVILAILAQRGLVFAPTKIKPKMSKISIISNAKNKFGRNGLFEFAKSFTKLVIYSIILGIFIQNKLPQMTAAISTSSTMIAKLLGQLCLELLFIIVLVSCVIGTIDAFWQHFEHLRKHRMSRKEITDETKEAEGDPHLKQARRMRAQSIATNQMMAEVPNADVIIVNPTHYAVALKWSRLPGSAPECVAKGVDEVAKRIREVANESAVPIHSDPPTARALHSTVEIGEEVPAELYSAVAAAIRFSEKIKQRKKQSYH